MGRSAHQEAGSAWKACASISSPKNRAYAAMMDPNWDLLRAGAGNLARLGLTVCDRSMTGGGTKRTYPSRRSMSAFGANRKTFTRLSLPLLNPQSTTEAEAHPALLEWEDCTPMAWYPSLYAPRTGGAYDSHHR